MRKTSGVGEGVGRRVDLLAGDFGPERAAAVAVVVVAAVIVAGQSLAYPVYRRKDPGRPFEQVISQIAMALKTAGTCSTWNLGDYRWDDAVGRGSERILGWDRPRRSEGYGIYRGVGLAFLYPENFGLEG